MARQLQTVRDERGVHSRHANQLTTAGARNSCVFPGVASVVPAVAGFGQRVGTEAEPDTQINELVDDVVVFPRGQVVDELRPLVTDETKTLEPRVMIHSVHPMGDATFQLHEGRPVVGAPRRNRLGR